jgi:hypothetical protein
MVTLESTLPRNTTDCAYLRFVHVDHHRLMIDSPPKRAVHQPLKRRSQAPSGSYLVGKDFPLLFRAAIYKIAAGAWQVSARDRYEYCFTFLGRG